MAVMKTNETQQMIKVWDGVVRTFHWSLVATFAGLYVTAHSGMQNTHIWLGYFLLFLLAIRIVWGFTGSRHARFSDFSYHPRRVLAYLKSIAQGRAQHYLGHNPAGAMMVFTLLVILLSLAFSGLVLQATIEFEGPLLELLHGMSDQTVYLFEELHSFMSNAMLALIGLHLLGVISATIQHHENLVRAMITGYKPALIEESK
jgi:cytochrome b